MYTKIFTVDAYDYEPLFFTSEISGFMRYSSLYAVGYSIGSHISGAA